MALTSATISILDVRNKNKDLLLTDGIPDTDIQEKIDEAIITVFSQIGETLDDTLIDDSNCPADIKLCIILVAASDAIISNYVDSDQAIKIAEMYSLRAKTSISAIVAGKRRFSQLQKQQTPLSIPFDYIQDDLDNRIDNYISRINNNY